MSHYVTIRFDFSDTSKYASIPLYIGFPATFIPFFIYIQSELSPLKTSCNAFPNRLVNISHLLMQEQRQFCYSFLMLFEWLLKGI